MCSWPSIPWGSSPALALARRVPKTSRSQRPSSPHATAPIPDCRALAPRPQVLYLTDKGFEGRAYHQHWREDYGAVVICAPKSNSRHPWSRPWRRWLAGLRQIVETVNGCLHQRFGLSRERPHALNGFQARLAAKAALHNFCIWLNEQFGRPRLAFADLIAW